MQRRRQPTGGIHPLLMGGRLFRVPGGPVPPPRLGSLDRSGGSDPIDESGQSYMPYDERAPIYAGAVGPVTVNAPPQVGVVPTGQTGWRNPNTFSSVPILASSTGQQPLLTLNYQRNALMIQNNSTATSPDTTPIFYIGFNAPVPQAGFGLALAAGVGVAWDYITPRDSIYVLQSGGAGATLVVAGVIVQGTYAPQ